MEIALNKYKSFSSTNEIENLSLDLVREEKLLPVSELQGKIDAYEQYLKEKDACNKYRFVFTIRPYCSNVLFNHITEAVYMEGSETAQVVLGETGVFGLEMPDESGNMQPIESIGYARAKFNEDYLNLTGTTPTALVNSPITRDTGYSCDTYRGYAYDSNPDMTYLNYNCGIDIFNNHLLRRKEFVNINQRNKDGYNNWHYNTLFDEARDPWKNTMTGFTYQSQVADGGTDTATELHLYNTDSVYSFTDAISHNLKEENGWFGFQNTSLLNTVNNGTTSNIITGIEASSGDITRIINNVDACTFVDLYPTKKHFSFVPNFNPYRKRLEKNWEYLLMYPYVNITNDYVTHDSGRNIDGIICEPDLDELTIEQVLGRSADAVSVPLTLRFRTHLKHTLVPNDRINLHVYKKNGGTSVYTAENILVSSTGKNGYDDNHYFAVQLNDVFTELSLSYDSTGTGTDLECRLEKIGSIGVCKYYIREFKKIPNLKNADVNIKDGITDDNINTALNTNDFSSTINKLGFSKTIYGDDIVQIVYDDDIEVTGLKDNLGREVSTIYLTLVKTNYGYTDWYKYSSGAFAPVCNDEGVEYSHCFGKVTSGFDLPSYVTNVNEKNVRKQHNITGNKNNVPDSSNVLEHDVSLRKDNWNYIFYGDIVELDEGRIEETVLEPIQHRFNTAQREFCDGTKANNPFANLVIDNIVSDDYTGGFSGTTTDAMCTDYWANLAPEGYYYQAHYPIKLKEFETTVQTGYHRQVEFTYDVESEDYTIVTKENYFLEKNTELYLYHINDKQKKYIANVQNVSGNDFTIIELRLPQDLIDTDEDLNNYIILKPNVLKPSGAYDFNDYTGKYIWRDVLPSSKIPRSSEIYDLTFTNGAIYIYKDINFYLHRQDPFGEYGLLPSVISECDGIQPADLEIMGNVEDISNGEYFEPGENNVC